jgi:hypothetical protein
MDAVNSLGSIYKSAASEHNRHTTWSEMRGRMLNKADALNRLDDGLGRIATPL